VRWLIWRADDLGCLLLLCHYTLVSAKRTFSSQIHIRLLRNGQLLHRLGDIFWMCPKPWYFTKRGRGLPGSSLEDWHTGSYNLQLLAAYYLCFHVLNQHSSDLLRARRKEHGKHHERPLFRNSWCGNFIHHYRNIWTGCIRCLWATRLPNER